MWGDESPGWFSLGILKAFAPILKDSALRGAASSAQLQDWRPSRRRGPPPAAGRPPRGTRGSRRSCAAAPAKINLTDAEVKTNLTWRCRPPRRNRGPAMLGCCDPAPCYPFACQHWGPRFCEVNFGGGGSLAELSAPWAMCSFHLSAFGGTTHRGLAGSWRATD